MNGVRVLLRGQRGIQEAWREFPTATEWQVKDRGRVQTLYILEEEAVVAQYRDWQGVEENQAMNHDPTGQNHLEQMMAMSVLAEDLYDALKGFLRTSEVPYYGPDSVWDNALNAVAAWESRP